VGVGVGRYLAASSASAYSMVAMLSAFGPMMPDGSSCVSLTYLASERVVPGYGGGMSSAKAQLESDTKVCHTHIRSSSISLLTHPLLRLSLGLTPRSRIPFIHTHIHTHAHTHMLVFY
jgi:hypothetical protein